ncbi:hypothetical protein H6CHR_05180 [Variovorax sp. PBL-H6]|nr:hypothetical protein [Variovorax sp. PBL-H6]VTU38273.1 hypothetical protein H6CHR_05180 [Variovorax sp. PBL-H6]
MELSSLFNTLDAAWIDDVILWSVMAVTGIAGLAVVVNALDVFFDAG